MRFGNTRSGLRNVLHIDLAFSLNGDRNISTTQFLIQTKASYQKSATGITRTTLRSIAYGDRVRLMQS